MWNLLPTAILSLFVNSSTFFMGFLKIISVQDPAICKTFFFPIWLPFTSFPCLFALAGTSRAV
jgi:hypothetical protein